MDKAAEVSRLTATPEVTVVGVENETATSVMAPSIQIDSAQITIKEVEQPVLPVAPPAPIEDFIPPYASKFPTVLGYDVAARDGYISLRRRPIARFRQQPTRIALILEFERLIAATRAFYGHPIVVQRQQTVHQVKRTEDAAIGVSVWPALDAARVSQQHTVLSTLNLSLADIDLAGRDGEVYREASCIVEEAERELIAWYQDFFERAYFADADVMLNYASSLVTDGVNVVPPIITKKWFWRSPRPFTPDLICRIADMNWEMWPSLTKYVYGYVTNILPRLTVEPQALQNATTMLGANIMTPNALGGLFDPAGAAGMGGATSENANAFVRGWMTACLTYGHSYMTFPVDSTVANPANILAMMMVFLFPTWLFPAYVIIALRNAIASLLYSMPQMDLNLASSGAVDYTQQANNLPKELVDFLHYAWPHAYEATDGRRAIYSANGSNIAYYYPMGFRVQSSDLNHPMLPLLSALVAKLKERNGAPKLKGRHKEDLTTMMFTFTGTMSSQMQLAYALQNVLHAMPVIIGARNEATSPEGYAIRDMAYPLNISVMGAISTLMAGVPQIHTTIVSQSVEQFRSSLIIARSAHILCDAWAIMRELLQDMSTFTAEKVAVAMAVYESMAPHNWFTRMFFDLTKNATTNSTLNLPVTNGPWIEEHSKLRAFVMNHPQYYGFVHEAVFWHGSVPLRNKDRISHSYEPPEEMSGASYLGRLQQRQALINVREFDDLLETMRITPVRLEGPFEAESKELTNSMSVPVQTFAQAFDAHIRSMQGVVSEIPLKTGTIYYYWRSAIDDDGFVPRGVGLSTPPTLVIKPPGDVEPNTDAAAYIANSAGHIRITKEGIRLMDLGSFTISFSRPF